MAKFFKRQFKNEDVHFDGNDYEYYSFEHCRLVYSGGDLPSFEGCSFLQSVFATEGAAERAVAFLKWLHAETAGSGQSLALQMLGIP